MLYHIFCQLSTYEHFHWRTHSVRAYVCQPSFFCFSGVLPLRAVLLSWGTPDPPRITTCSQSSAHHKHRQLTYLLLYHHHFLCCLFKLASNRKGSKSKRILPHNLPQIETLTSWATFYFIGYHPSHTYFTNFERCFLVHRILWSSCRSSFRQAWRLSHRGRNLPLLVGEQNNLRQYGDLEKVA